MELGLLPPGSLNKQTYAARPGNKLNLRADPKSITNRRYVYAMFADDKANRKTHVDAS